MVNLCEWKTWLAGYGMDRAANELGIAYESVRRWVRGHVLPEGKNLRGLVALAHREMDPASFEEFLASLSSEVLGHPVADRGERAVNE